MNCIYCGFYGTRVKDSREAPNNEWRRRRECQKCKKRFTTYEIAKEDDNYRIGGRR